MSDLTGELLRMAAEGADRARPLAVADVMRRGNRRRARAIGQRSLGGLSVLGVGLAVVMAGALYPGHGSSSRPASGGATGGITLTETTRSPAGTMTVQVRYRDEARDKIKPLSITFAGKSEAVKEHAFAVVRFGPVVPSGPTQNPGCAPSRSSLAIALRVRVNKNGDFAGSFTQRLLRLITQHGGLCGNEVIRLSLIKAAQNPGRGVSVGPGTIMTAALILSR